MKIINLYRTVLLRPGIRLRIRRCRLHSHPETSVQLCIILISSLSFIKAIPRSPYRWFAIPKLMIVDLERDLIS